MAVVDPDDELLVGVAQPLGRFGETQVGAVGRVAEQRTTFGRQALELFLGVGVESAGRPKALVAARSVGFGPGALEFGECDLEFLAGGVGVDGTGVEAGAGQAELEIFERVGGRRGRWQEGCDGELQGDGVVPEVGGVAAGSGVTPEADFGVGHGEGQTFVGEHVGMGLDLDAIGHAIGAGQGHAFLPEILVVAGT
ncbi:MAG: hypothetical protein ACP5U2_02685 [Bryobacteraceae bacterium]